MNKSETITKLATALAKAQAEMPAAAMNATNPFLKNRYADLGSVIQTAKPVLAKHGLSVSQLTGGYAGNIELTTILMHESGEWISSSIRLPLGDERGKSQAQVAGSIITYLRRYSLASILGMYADEDNDGNEPASKPQPEHKPASKPAPQGMTPSLYDALVQAGHADNVHNARKMLDLSNLPDDVLQNIAIAWARNYRAFRDEGDDTQAAAEKANAKYTAYVENN